MSYEMTESAPDASAVRCAHPGCAEQAATVAGGLPYCSTAHVPEELRGTVKPTP